MQAVIGLLIAKCQMITMTSFCELSERQVVVQQFQDDVADHDRPDRTRDRKPGELALVAAFFQLNRFKSLYRHLTTIAAVLYQDGD